ncbi:unnamed protein product [Caenorhabditis bovis]|uniref:SET domain-containing protein n=1 Tax=Caenorhabditis bovis TaxID=2654633 RepID=A0A8S1F193_9PELO|nr:unnamed protein product [Caenorhabditis bovis]
MYRVGLIWDPIQFDDGDECEWRHYEDTPLVPIFECYYREEFPPFVTKNVVYGVIDGIVIKSDHTSVLFWSKSMGCAVYQNISGDELPKIGDTFFNLIQRSLPESAYGFSCYYEVMHGMQNVTWRNLQIFADLDNNNNTQNVYLQGAAKCVTLRENGERFAMQYPDIGVISEGNLHQHSHRLEIGKEYDTRLVFRRNRYGSYEPFIDEILFDDDEVADCRVVFASVPLNKCYAIKNPCGKRQRNASVFIEIPSSVTFCALGLKFGIELFKYNMRAVLRPGNGTYQCVSIREIGPKLKNDARIGLFISQACGWYRCLANIVDVPFEGPARLMCPKTGMGFVDTKRLAKPAFIRGASQIWIDAQFALAPGNIPVFVVRHAASSIEELPPRNQLPPPESAAEMFAGCNHLDFSRIRHDESEMFYNDPNNEYDSDSENPMDDLNESRMAPTCTTASVRDDVSTILDEIEMSTKYNRRIMEVGPSTSKPSFLRANRRPKICGVRRYRHGIDEEQLLHDICYRYLHLRPMFVDNEYMLETLWDRQIWGNVMMMKKRFVQVVGVEMHDCRHHFVNRRCKYEWLVKFFVISVEVHARFKFVVVPSGGVFPHLPDDFQLGQLYDTIHLSSAQDPLAHLQGFYYRGEPYLIPSNAPHPFSKYTVVNDERGHYWIRCDVTCTRPAVSPCQSDCIEFWSNGGLTGLICADMSILSGLEKRNPQLYDGYEIRCAIEPICGNPYSIAGYYPQRSTFIENDNGIVLWRVVTEYQHEKDVAEPILVQRNAPYKPAVVAPPTPFAYAPGDFSGKLEYEIVGYAEELARDRVDRLRANKDHRVLFREGPSLGPELACRKLDVNSCWKKTIGMYYVLNDNLKRIQDFGIWRHLSRSDIRQKIKKYEGMDDNLHQYCFDKRKRAIANGCEFMMKLLMEDGVVDELESHSALRQLLLIFVDCVSSNQSFYGKNAEMGELMQIATSNVVVSSSNMQPAVLTRNVPKIVFGQGVPLVLGEKILLPAGMLQMQGPLQHDGTTTAATANWQSSQVKVAGTFNGPIMISTAGQTIQARPLSKAGNYDGAPAQVRRATTKVVQAVPFTTRPASQQGTGQRKLTSSPAMVTLAPVTSLASWVVSPPAAQQATSSDTPDSGIQSIATSPPTPHMTAQDGSVCEEKDECLEDFADMPRLLPADQEVEEEEASESFPGPSTTLLPPAIAAASSQATQENFKEDGASHGSECETAAAPSISISPSMDSDEIVSRLLALDPEKASAIANLIKKKTQMPRKRKTAEKDDSSVSAAKPKKLRNGKNGSASGSLKSTASTSCAIATRSRSPCREKLPISLMTDQEEFEVTEEASPPAPPKPPAKKRPATPVKPDAEISKEDMEIKYRLAVQKRIEEAMARELEGCIEDLGRCHIGSYPISRSNQHKKGHQQSFVKSLEHVKHKLEKRARRESRAQKIRAISRRSRCETPQSEEPIAGHFNGEYEEIPRSVAGSSEVYQYWKAPTLVCGCTKGACTSDVECVNRAMRVQCSAECSLTLCANKKFWKEDTSKLCISNGPKSKRCLKTRGARRAGELLCEYAGEVITSREAIARAALTPSEARILCIGANLFVDATNKGNHGRFVKHHCRPNSRLEIWSINGYYRAGIFALYDIASGCEITIDKSGLVPQAIVCQCGSSNCCKIVRPSRHAHIMANSIGEGVKTRRFLSRNRRQTIRRVGRSSGLPRSLSCDGPSECVKTSMKRVFDAVAYRVRNIDGSLRLKFVPGYTAIKAFLKSGSGDIEEFDKLVQKWLNVVNDDDIDRSYIAIKDRWFKHFIQPIGEKKRRQRNSSTSAITPVTPSKKLDADLSYLDSAYPIGSYDPDDAWTSYTANANDNAVRCVCGALDEDGEMVQCDDCHFWLHIDCVAGYNPDADYVCEFCTQHFHRPSRDVRLQPQPDVRFEGCDYFKALVNRRGIQVRLNETVYVNKKISDEHKSLLRNLKEEDNKKKKSHRKKEKDDVVVFPKASTKKLAIERIDRKDARIFRVERLFTTPGDHRFVFGSYYAWPHETFVDTQRMFSTSEVFPTPLYDTLPLDEVIGRCMVVDVETWVSGRPKVPSFKDEDVFFCEFQLAKNQRCFEKVPPKNRYPINTQSYVFDKFRKSLPVVRNFKPYERTTPSGRATRVEQLSPYSRETAKERELVKKAAKKNLEKIIEKMKSNR